MTIRSVRLISFLRWAIPLILSLVGTGYILIEQAVLQNESISSPSLVRTVLFLGLFSPFLAWLALSWAMRATIAESEAQQELAFRNRELAALNAIGRAASQSLDSEKVLKTALEKMVELLELEAGDIRLVEAGQLILKVHYGMPADFEDRERIVEFGHCQCGTCALTGEVLTQNDLPRNSACADSLCGKEGFRSAISIPMTSQGRLIGLVHAASRHANAFGSRDQQILTGIAERVAIALENAKLYEEAHRRAVHLETVSLVGQRVSSLLDSEALLAETVKLIGEKFGYLHTHILLVDEAGQELVLTEASGPCAETMKQKGVRLKIGKEGITGWVAQTGKLLLCNDVSGEPRYFAAEPETGAELSVPLRVGDHIIGVLDVQSERRNAFDTEDATVLQILGSQIGSAIENARLFQETRQRYEAMIALHETSLDMIAQLDMPKLLEALLRRGTKLLGAEAGILFLHDTAQDVNYVVASHNTWRDWTGVRLNAGEGVIGQVIQTGKPLIVNDYANFPVKPEAFAGSPDHPVMSAPLWWRNQVIGGINVFTTDPGARPFRENDLWLLGLFADLATIAIKNSELHCEIKEFNQGLEQKVELRTRELRRTKEELASKAEQLRLLLTQTINIQEEERTRIARDMHDGVVQLITAVRYELRAAKTAVESASPVSAKNHFNAIREILDEMEREIRHAIYDLQPPTLGAVGLVSAIQSYVARFEKLSGTACRLQVIGTPFRLSPPTETGIFRMVEQSLHNAAMHANAQTASISVDFGPYLLRVIVQDDGQGFDYEQWLADRTVEHLGLVGMQERAQSLGGTLEIWSKPGQGTRLTFRLAVALDGSYPVAQESPVGSNMRTES